MQRQYSRIYLQASFLQPRQRKTDVERSPTLSANLLLACSGFCCCISSSLRPSCEWLNHGAYTWKGSPWKRKDMMITKYKSKDSSRKVAQKRHLTSTHRQASIAAEAASYTRNTPLTDITANCAGEESVGWCSWHSCWCKERNRALCQGNGLPSPLSAATIPVRTNSCSKWKVSSVGALTLAKLALSLCVLHCSSPAGDAEFC